MMKMRIINRFLCLAGIALIIVSCFPTGFYDFQDYYDHLLENYTDNFLKTVPCDENSSLTIISISHVPLAGGQSQIRGFELVTIVDGKTNRVPDSAYQYLSTTHDVKYLELNIGKIYIFNLEEGEYYISKVYPMISGGGEEKGNPCDDIVKLDGSMFIYIGDDDTANPLLLASSCDAVYFNQTNFKAYPFKVEKGKLKVYGNFKIERKIALKDSAEIVKTDPVDREAEIKKFLEMAEHSAWKECIKMID